jgi:23S rRNA pseudouridine1911/1915/1917 synthase
MNLKFTITENDNNKSIKEFLKQNQISRNLLITLKKNHSIFCNSRAYEVYRTINTGDIITVNLEYEEDNSNVVASPIPLDILYEDDAYLVINKPPNIAIHPSMLHYDTSLSNGVKYYFDSIRFKEKN